MAGLLDMVNDPRQAFLTNLGMGLLSAGGPSARPVSLGQAFGAAMPGALQGAQQAQTYQAQVEEARRKQEAEQRRMQALSTMPPEFQQAVAIGAPVADVWKQFNPEAKFESYFDPTSGQERKGFIKPGAAPVPVGGAKAESMEYDKVLRAAGILPGTPQYTQMMRQYADKQARHAPAVQVNTGRSFEATFLEDQSKQLDTAYNAALGSRGTVLAAQQVLGALENNPYSGPGTKFKVAAAQLFGSDPDRLMATRQAIQGLAKIGVAARKQLQGQGTITDDEAKALNKAESGDVDEMTIEEIRFAASGAEKAGLFNLQQYEKKRQAFSSAANNPLVRNVLESQKIEGIAPYQRSATSYPTPNQAAISRLKMQPALQADFDAKFGPGAAARAMGK